MTINDPELIGLLATLLSAMFGTQQVQRYRDRKEKLDGGDGAGQIVRAIREEGKKHREALEEHTDTTREAVSAFQGVLAQMKQDCAVAHARLSEQMVRKG